MPRNWEARERKVQKRTHGHVVDGRSIFVIQEANKKRDKKRIDKARRNDDRRKSD